MITEFDGKYAFLSNFYHAPFTYDGIEYPTNEHFFQAMKTLDQEERKKIAAAASPGKADEMVYYSVPTFAPLYGEDAFDYFTSLHTDTRIKSICFTYHTVGYVNGEKADVYIKAGP